MCNILKLLQILQNVGLIYVREDELQLKGAQRLGLAVRAVRLGADVETVSGLLRWQEFESFAAVAFQDNGYEVTRNLRFKYGGRRWELDIVAFRKPLVICIDCKHWHRRLHKSTMVRVVEEQRKRTQALARSLPNRALKIEYELLRQAKFVPAILSLVAENSKFSGGVPIVPVLQLQDFVVNLPLHVDSTSYLTCESSQQNHVLSTDFDQV